MRNLFAAVVLVVLAAFPTFAGVSGQMYGNGQKAATLCALLEMYEDVSFNGFIDLNRDGSWFSKTHLVKGTGNLALATELRASSSGYRSFAVSPQLTLSDNAGRFTVNPWYDTEGTWVVSISQFHNLGGRFWTYSWTDICHGEAKGTLRVGHKESPHVDTFAEYRFNTQTRDSGIFAGINLH